MQSNGGCTILQRPTRCLPWHCLLRDRLSMLPLHLSKRCNACWRGHHRANSLWCISRLQYSLIVGLPCHLQGEILIMQPLKNPLALSFGLMVARFRHATLA